jgi:cytochrome c peroxidase
MKFRVSDEGTTNFILQPQDYEGVLKEAFAKKDTTALAPLGLDATKDLAKSKEVAAKLKQGRDLFFGKARCSLCHVGDTYSDGQFHNLGVGAKDGRIPAASLGRYGALPLGHKNPEMVGAFKTPGLRGLASIYPYMHNGSEDSLEKVIELYDRGGNPNEYLAPKMRDMEAERAYTLSKKNGTAYNGPKVYLCGPDEKPIVPFALKLTPPEKGALIAFLHGLQGEVDALVTEPTLRVPTGR